MAPHTDVLDTLAEALWQAQQPGRPYTPIPAIRETVAALGGDAAAHAYAIQERNTRRQLASGRRLVGRKIGLTAKAVQAQLGVAQPDFGMLFDYMAYCDGEEIPMAATHQPKVEAEIALVLERDLVHERHTVAELIGAVAYALPAIEVVGSRIENWDIGYIDTVADNASSGLFVLGSRPVRLDAFDLLGCGMVLELRGEPLSTGVGAACLGNPLHAAKWLADTMVRVGAPLRAGDIVLTGALGPMAPVAPGDVFSATIDGLGTVRAAFANDTEQAP